MHRYSKQTQLACVKVQGQDCAPITAQHSSALSYAETDLQGKVVLSLPNDEQGLEINRLHFSCLFYSEVALSSEITLAMDGGTSLTVVSDAMVNSSPGAPLINENYVFKSESMRALPLVASHSNCNRCGGC